MEKKELKFYEAPVMSEVELKHQGILCGSTGNADGIVDPVPDDGDFDLD